VRLLLDTAVLIFASHAPERLSERARALLANPSNLRELSSVSVVEIAIKVALGKLDISLSGVERALEDMDVRVLPFTGEHAFHMFEVPAHHRDPFDRQIIAQALYEKIPVITSDEKFSLYKGLKVIW
jgi:PIN domain nuclease of toxin-antitoxin system